MTASIVEVIQHYQRSIDNSQDNEDRVEHLQETGVGKTVNSLRKFNGEIGVAAKSLVMKWKAMVAAQEEPMDTTTPHDYDNETHDSNHNHDDHDDEQSPHNSGGGGGGDGVMDDEDHENQNQNIAQEEHKHSGHSGKEKHKERHKDRNHKESSSKHASSSTKDTDDKHKSSSSSSSRDKEGHQHKSSSSSSSKEREKEKTEHKSREKHKDKERDHSEKRKEEKHKSEKESTSHKSSSSKSRSDDKPSSSSKDKPDKERSDKHKSSSKDRDRSKEDKSSSKDKNERKSTSSSSSHKSSSAKDTSEPTERKRRNTSDTESNDFKSPQPKVAKVSKSSSSSTKAAESSPPQENDTDDSFDSSMGANFGDILGMLNAPSKKGKKSLKPSTSVGGSTSSSAKDSPKPSTSNSITPKPNGIPTSPSVYSPQTPTKISTAKPDLLAPTLKLAPLDPSIALELPTISTNYKPMPLNQTVMDCVFNTSSSSNSRPARTLTDAEALHHGISSKTMRTKIYSGVRTGQIFQVPSLFDMCIRILQKNIDALEYTGGVPFEVLRPVLDRATPQQLYIFEDYNPYLMEDSDVLWQTHVSRNYRTQKRLENESWREMFMRCQEEEERRLSILKNSIKQSQKIAAAPVRKTQLAFVDSMVKPPRNVMRKQEQYGTKAKLVATPAARVASLQSVTPNAAKTGDQRLRVAPIVRDHAQVASSAVRPKKAPLMQKTLAFIRGRLKR